MVQEADYSMTSMALNGQQARADGDASLLVKFFMSPVVDHVRTEEEQRPCFKEVAHIQILQPGNKDSIIVRRASNLDIDRFPEHYRKFQARVSQDDVSGTLLSEWPRVTRAQVEELKFFNILTVEQLAATSDSNAQNFMGFTKLKQLAADYVDTAESGLVRQELDAANAELAEMRAMLEELTANASTTNDDNENDDSEDDDNE